MVLQLEACSDGQNPECIQECVNVRVRVRDHDDRGRHFRDDDDHGYRDRDYHECDHDDGRLDDGRGRHAHVRRERANLLSAGYVVGRLLLIFRNLEYRRNR